MNKKPIKENVFNTFNLIIRRDDSSVIYRDMGYISSRNNYHRYRNINDEFTVKVREQYHIRDLMGRISSCRGPLERRDCAPGIADIFDNCSNCLDNLTMRRYLLQNSNWRRKTIGKTDETGESFHGAMECSGWPFLHYCAYIPARSSLWLGWKPLRPPYSKVKLRSFHYESSKAVYSV